MVDQSIIKEIRQYLARVAEAGIPVASAVLFGSYARGEQRRESDIDILVLSPSFDDGVDFDTANELWRLTRYVDSRIEPHAVGVREFAEDDSSPLIGIARREGVPVCLKRR
jgi:predicted nucleotidyltransferase